MSIFAVDRISFLLDCLQSLSHLARSTLSIFAHPILSITGCGRENTGPAGSLFLCIFYFNDIFPEVLISTQTHNMKIKTKQKKRNRNKIIQKKRKVTRNSEKNKTK